MPKFTDENQVLWDIKTTTIQKGTDPTTSTWFAGIDDGATRDYSGNTFNREFDTFDARGGQDNKVTWPASGNPILRGPGGNDDALAGIRRFAAQEKREGLKTIALRVTASPGTDGSFVPLLVILALVFLVDRRR
jgi:hypothetical protein